MELTTRGRVSVIVVAALVAATLLGEAPGQATPDATPVRVAGADRIDTAAQVARAFLAPRPETSTALVARADDFPDALAAATLAGAVDGPVLLTHRGALSPTTRQVLHDLSVDEVLLLGGTAALSAEVERALATEFAVERIQGVDRYATAAAVALAAAERGGVGVLDGRRTVLLASGVRFADALAAGPAAAAGPHPLLLTTPESLPEVTAEALTALRAEHVIVLGGTAVISDAVLTAVAARGPTVERIAGPERTATAARFADVLVARFGFPDDAVVLARADDFPDALAAGPWAGHQRSPVLLAQQPEVLGTATRRWLAERCGRVRAIQTLGGTAAVALGTSDDALRAARICAADPGTFAFPAATAFGSGVSGDPGAFRDIVRDVLADPQGWAQPGALELPLAAEADADLVLVLASGEEIAAVSTVCHAGASCRVGDRLYVHAGHWGTPPLSWGGDVAGYRRWVVNHLVGHWLGHPHVRCPGPGHRAPVMQEQEGDLGGCTPGSRPTDAERRAVHQRYIPSVDIAFAGDVHGEGVVRSELLAGHNPLGPIAPVLSAADLAVVNLETAVGTSGRPANKTFTFQAPVQLVHALAEAGVDVVTLANNHALDYGVEAMFETIRHAEAAGLSVVGAGRNAEEAYAPALIDVRGRTVAIVGLSRVLSPGWAAGPGRPGLASAYDEAAAAAAVRRAVEVSDHVVVAIHWGIELAECPDAHQLRLARILTDAGADVIAGHHPHILQGIQVRQDAIVAYSLGNFVWYHRREPSRYTGVLTAALPDPGRTHAFTPAEIDGRGRPLPVDGALAQRIERDVAARSPGGGRCGF